VEALRSLAMQGSIGAEPEKHGLQAADDLA
jgi:hypothetical protein